MNNLFRPFILFLCVLLAACATQDVQSRIRAAESIAAQTNMVAHIISAPPFQIQSWQRGGQNAVARIYIEGDGLAYVSPDQISPDPTPRNPVALRLAVADNAPLVIYLGRPCQYIQSDICAPKYWTTARTAPEVITAYDTALNQIKSQYGVKRFELVGYSGGAAAASLVAARRNDILNLRTVAGNLDYAEFTRLHNISAMDSSLDPISVAAQLANLPQIHFVGGKDDIVPFSIVEQWRQHSQHHECIRSHILPGLDHGGNWAEIWNQLLDLQVECKDLGNW